MQIEYTRPTLDDAAYITAHLKQDNKEEMLAAVGDNALQDMIYGIKTSDDIGCLKIDGRAVAIYGVKKASIMSDYGLAWLLMTEEAERHKVFIAKATKKGLAGILSKYSLVYNHCNAQNKSILRWLHWLGAKIYLPKPYGVYKIPHCYFEFRRGKE